MKSRVIKIICLIFTLIFTVFTFSWYALAGVLTNNPMKDTSVEDDLSKLGVNTSGYGLDTTADFVSIIDFVEYGYDARGNQQYYGLYIYLYNPCGKEIRGAYVQLNYKKHTGDDTGVKKYRLEVVDTNDESVGSKYTLYKLRVKNSDDIAADLPLSVRTYSVSGIEIRYSITDSSNAVDYDVSGTWIFSGYQENCGRADGDPNTLSCKYEVEETIRTELHSANWFSATSDLGPDYRYEVSSVYFNIPNYYINKYGNLNDETSGLYSVQGEYYKYVTNGVLINDERWLGSLNVNLGKNLSGVSGYSDCTTGSGGGFYKVGSVFKPTGINRYDVSYDLTYNMFISKSYNPIYGYNMGSSNILDRLCHVLVPTSGYVDRYVSADEFLSIYNKNNQRHFSTSEGLVLNGKIGALGRIPYDISVDGESLNSSIKSFAESELAKPFISELGNILYMLYNKALYVDANGYKDIRPLVEIEASDISSVFTDESISENLFITVDDVAGLREFYKDMDLNNHIYLMRFDVNPYYAPEVVVVADKDALTDGPLSEDEKGSGYYFEKAVYHDFDILSFTFKDAKNKVVTVPVSCDPVDIVGSVVPGPGGIDDPNNPKTEAPNVPTGCKLSDYKLPFRILIIVGGLFAFFFVVNLILKAFGKSISWVFTGIGTLITAPFKGAAALGKGIMSLTDRKLDRDIKKTNLENSKVKSSDQHEKHIDDIGLNHRREDRLGKLTDQRIRIEKQHEKSMKSDNYFKEEKVKEYKAAKTVKKEQSQKDKDVTDWFNQRINNTFGDDSSEKKK